MRAARLRAEPLGASLLDGLPNIKDDELGTYCVRCLVWRWGEAHHCSTCGR